MFRFTLFSIFAFSASQPLQFAVDLPSGAKLFEDQLNNTLTNLSDALSKYDPLSIPLVDFEINNELLKGKFRFEDVVLIGFSKFVATDLKINLIPPSATIELTFPKIQIVSPVYDFYTKMVFIPLYGKGSLSLLVKDIHLGGSGTADIGAEGVSGIQNLKVIFNVTESVLHMSGLFDNEPVSQIVSTSTTECFPKFIHNYRTRLGELVALPIESIINAALAGKSIDKVIPQKGSIKQHSTGSGISVRCQF